MFVLFVVQPYYVDEPILIVELFGGQVFAPYQFFNVAQYKLTSLLIFKMPSVYAQLTAGTGSVALCPNFYRDDDCRLTIKVHRTPFKTDPDSIFMFWVNFAD